MKQNDNFFMIDSAENEVDFIPFQAGNFSDEQENDLPESLPILPLRNTVMFPGVMLPISIGREKSLQLIKDVYKKTNLIGTVAQKNRDTDDPTAADLYQVGTVARIVKIFEMPDGSTSVIIQGKSRFQIDEMLQEEPYHVAHISIRPEKFPDDEDKEYDALVSSLKELSIKVIELSENIPQEAVFAVKNIDSPAFLVNYLASNSNTSAPEKQNLLEEDKLKKRGTKLLEHLAAQIQKLKLRNDIQTKVQSKLDQQQREFLLNQEMRTIQNELGGDPAQDEVNELRKRAKKKKWDEKIAETFEKNLERMLRINPSSPEYSNQMDYLQVLLELPWNEYTKDNFNLKRAEKILNNDHYGLDNVKDRILEHLAVLKLKGDLKSPIICLYGPPGVGKTSLGRSIATSLNRKYIRMSLGGLHDEAEIRGHRKTYIGAMPGRIIQNIKKVQSSNPVFVLDEIDKIGNDFRGDPSFALLEVLDPEQNNTFHDNYIELDYDLSKVLFIATANSLANMKPALLDRMELIHVSGYIVEEKIEIARQHLIPKQLKEHGITKKQLSLSKNVIENIVVNYTQESGVRQLDKQIAKLARKIAKKIGFEENYKARISISDLTDLLGIPKFLRQKHPNNELAGVVTGLAWTAVGGQILLIESSLSKGQGKLSLTGNLGQVMKESAIIAHEYLKSHASDLQIDESIFENWNVHIHVPEGAIPKDGPSAGITMATSLASLYTQRKIRAKLAMTGEITLRGKVLPVGGIKEKILAAKRADIKDIILSKDNQKDIQEIKEIYVKGVNFHYVENIMEVLDIALLKQRVAKPRSFKIE